MARREPVVKSTQQYDPHRWDPNPFGPRTWDGKPTECKHCPFPEGNGVHDSSEEPLPPTPAEDRSKEILGESND